ncbi:hypothetical protein [Ideonella sp. YS5]|uniref:hypothetical protein n=1 Tax=Ideonella sp. YS5 TaxID=3453714 RepID=UPI003EE9E089
MSEQSGRRKALECRPVLIGLQAFGHLRGFQAAMPQPRLDMRYLVEGSIELLRAEPEARERWLQAARGELVRELADYRDGSGAAAARDPGDARVAAGGTGGRTAAEGARTAVHARAHGASRTGSVERNGCKSLLLSAEAFHRLRAIQGTTRQPRLELRYLVDGAVALLHQDVASHAAWVQQARMALSMHLSYLQQQPVPHHMEIKT